MAKKHKKLNVFEAFAGIGAQASALDKAHINYKIVGISDWFIDAVIAYDAIHCKDLPEPKKVSLNEEIAFLDNFTYSRDSINPLPSVKRLSKDVIHQLYVAHHRTRNFGSILDIKGKDLVKLNIDLLTYSFPCQDLSTGGKTLGMAKGSGTRSGLLWQIERILKEMKAAGQLPKYLLLENVKTILAESNKKDFKMWTDFLESIGYKKHHTMICDASDFGVPQDRKRAIMVSCLDKEIDIENELRTSRDYDARDFIFNDYKNPIYKHEADLASLNPTISREYMWKINKRELSKDTIFHTITCNLDRSNNAGMLEYHLFPKRKYRLITMREAFLLMGFSVADYEAVIKLGYSYRKINKLVGNSIVVNVLASVFYTLFGDDYAKI